MEISKYHIFVCTQTKPPMVPSCGGMGAGKIMELFRKEVFNAGLENEVVVSSSGCIGICNRGANVMIFPEGKYYTAVKEADVKLIVDQHIKGGQVVTNRNDPDTNIIKSEVNMFSARIKAMMADAGAL